MQGELSHRVFVGLSAAVLCYTVLTTSPGFAQEKDLSGQRPIPLLSSEEVTAEFLDWNAYQADALSGSAAVNESSWAHGSGAQHEQLSGKTPFTHYGYGSYLGYVAGTKNAVSGWVHFAIPTPVVSPQKKSARLHSVLLAIDVQAGIVDEIDVWDGYLYLLGKGVSYSGNHLSGTGLIKIEFATPPAVSAGIGISVRYKNYCSGDTCPLKVLFASAGAEFIR